MTQQHLNAQPAKAPFASVPTKPFILTIVILLFVCGDVKQAFGQRVSQEEDLHGDRLIFRDDGQELFSDVARVYRREGGVWVEEAALESPTTVRYVAIHDTLAFQGSTGNQTIHVYARSGTDWIPHSEVRPLEPEIPDAWGVPLRFLNNELLVGAFRYEDRGAVYVHRWNGSGWDETILSPPELEPVTAFGSPFAVSDSLLAVSAFNPTSNERRIYTYRRAGQSWTFDSILESPAQSERGFRLPLDMDGTTLAVAIDDDSRGFPVQILDYDFEEGTWVRTTLLPPPGLIFTFRVGLDGNTVALWAWQTTTCDACERRRIVVANRDSVGAPWTVSQVLEPPVSLPTHGIVSASLGDGTLLASQFGGWHQVYQAQIFVRDPVSGEWTFEQLIRSRPFPEPITGSRVECTAGLAGPFACDRIDLLAYLPRDEIGAVTRWESGDGLKNRLSGIWGWTDPESGREFVISASSAKTSFIEITDVDQGLAPIYLGEMPYSPASCGDCTWTRTLADVEVYTDHAFVVSYERSGSGRLQVFDLSRLLDPENDSGPKCDPNTNKINRQRCFAPDAEWIDSNGVGVADGFASAPNLTIDAQSGFGYAVGAELFEDQFPNCVNGDNDLYSFDVRDPLNPKRAGCYNDPEVEGWDAQCVTYRGPDSEHAGRELCFLFATTALQIVDMTNKANPSLIASVVHPDVSFVNQGWLSADQSHLFMTDDLDEEQFGHNTRTIVWDLNDLDAPQIETIYFGDTGGTDRNVFVDESIAFLATSSAGLTVLDVSDPANPIETGRFDTYPPNDLPDNFQGAFSVYPFFPSGNVAVSGVEQGVFILRPTAVPVTREMVTYEPEGFALSQNYPNPFHKSTEITFSLPKSGPVRINVYDLLGREVAVILDEHMPAGKHRIEWEPPKLSSGAYFYRLEASGDSRTKVATVLR